MRLSKPQNVNLTVALEKITKSYEDVNSGNHEYLFNAMHVKVFGIRAVRISVLHTIIKSRRIHKNDVAISKANLEKMSKSSLTFFSKF